jgi:nucleotide-binding universal stress UspA family protein
MSVPVVLVPLDGSEHSLDALPVAKVLAHLEGATIHLVHIAREVAPPADVLRHLGLDAWDLRGSVLRSKTGNPAEGIIQAARESHCILIVMCTHTAVARPGRSLGSTALGVLKDALCPVVLVQPERGVAPWSLHRILLPHDGTPTASAAMRSAAEFARSANAELDILHVAGLRAHPSERGSLTFRYMDQPQHEWPAWAGEFIKRLHCVCPLESLKVRISAAHGSPGEEVLRFAAEHASDLIVLAWKGEWEGDHAATAKAIIRRAPCPVMVVRAAAAPCSETGIVSRSYANE